MPHGIIIRPPVLEVTSSFREAYAAGRFTQRELIDQSDLIREASEHKVAIDDETLEDLDKAGAFTPIAFGGADARGHFYGPRWDIDHLSFRDEIGFRAWRRHRFVEERTRKPRQTFHRTIALYSPWQLLYLKSAVENRWEAIDRRPLLGKGESLLRLQRNFRPFARVNRKWWLAMEPHWRPTVLLLCWLQNRYLPYVSGSTSLIPNEHSHDYRDPLPDEIRSFDAHRLLQQLGLTVEDVQKTYEQLAFFGQAVDPIESWFLVVRAARPKAHARFKGDARLAQLVYDAAEILRRYLADLTGEVPPDADQVGGWPRGWKERFLGHEPRIHYDRADFKKILEQHGLSPYGVHVFVEGASDQELIAGLIDALWGDHRAIGVRFTVLSGIGNLARYQTLFDAFSTYARFALLVADDEGKLERDVERLRRDGLLIDEESVHTWKRNLEEDNASLGELVNIAKQITQSKGHKLRLSQAAIKRVRQTQSQRRGATSIIKDIARQQHIPLTKTEIAVELRGRILKELEASTDRSDVEQRRPALTLAVNIGRFSASL